MCVCVVFHHVGVGFRTTQGGKTGREEWPFYPPGTWLLTKKMMLRRISGSMYNIRGRRREGGREREKSVFLGSKIGKEGMKNASGDLIFILVVEVWKIFYFRYSTLGCVCASLIF